MYENDNLTKFLSLIYQSDASRYWLSPNFFLEKFMFEMTFIDTNDASCPGVMFHFDALQAGASFRKGRPCLFLRLEN